MTPDVPTIPDVVRHEEHQAFVDDSENPAPLDAPDYEYEKPNSHTNVIAARPDAQNSTLAPVEADLGLATIFDESEATWEPSVAEHGGRFVVGEYRLVREDRPYVLTMELT